MPDRKMFWRIVRRLLGANRGRLFVILLALGAGAAVTAALLNLQVDAKRRLTSEFRAFGANVVVAPHESGNLTESPRFLDESLFPAIPENLNGGTVTKAEFLYGIVDVAKAPAADPTNTSKATKAVLAGFSYSRSNHPERILPSALLQSPQAPAPLNSVRCDLGQRVASALQLRSGEAVVVTNGDRKQSCDGYILPATGGSEDSQIFLDLLRTQALLQQFRHISLIQLSVSGTSGQIKSYISALTRTFPDAEIRPIRQFTEGEAKIYNRISGILTATVALVLLLTGLCVMAAMTNIAMERRNDVGLMKAVGGATRRVLRLFLVEAALMGLAGGILGAGIGILLSIWLGKAVFGLAAQPRLIVYPVAVALTIIVAIAGAYPLRRLANIRPASIFRGEA